MSFETDSEGSAQQLLDFIQANNLDYQKLIVINSPGGNVSAALELGTLIRKRGMRVIVGRTHDFEPEDAGRDFQTYDAGVCASACVFVLMGGQVRELADDESQVGVHQFAPAADELGSIASTTSSTQSVMALLQAYAASMGVDPAVLALASLTRPEDMMWLEPQQMERLNLLTSRKYERMARWSLMPSGSLLMAAVTQEQTNGRKTVLVVDCQHLNVGFEVQSDRVREIAASIQKASLTLDGTQWSYPLPIAEVSTDDQMVMVTFLAGAKVMAAIAQANDTLNLDIYLPWAYMEEFGGPAFDIPTSNFAELSPHVLNSCR